MDPVAFRRHLHRYPELSFREKRTHDYIRRTLDELGIPCRTIADTGVLATVAGNRASRRSIVLRADIDALPIDERSGVAWSSLHPGVMHACGHDVHAAILAGVLQELHAAPEFEGTVFGLFQPGEECNPGGASRVLEADPFAGYDVIAVIGEHVEPTLEVGTFGFRAGKYMASNDELRFRIEGSGGHAALRNLLRDPVAAAARFITGLLECNTSDRVVSIGRVEADGATNVVPDTVYLEGTMRTFDETLRSESYDLIRSLARSVGRTYGVTIRDDINRGYPCVVNDPDLTARARASAEAAGYLTTPLALRATAEDFGFYCTRYPSLFYRIGVGPEAGSTHSPAFRPDERAIPIGIAFMRDLTLHLLNES